MMARGYDQIRCPQQQRQLLSLGHSGPHVEVTAAAANRFIGFFSFAHHRVASTRVAMKCCPKVGCSISLSNLFFHWRCAVRCCGAVHWKHFRFVRVQMLRQSGNVCRWRSDNRMCREIIREGYYYKFTVFIANDRQLRGKIHDHDFWIINEVGKLYRNTSKEFLNEFVV